MNAGHEGRRVRDGAPPLSSGKTTARCPSSRSSRIWHALKWMLAVAGVFCVHIVMQELVAATGATVCMVVSEFGGGDFRAMYRDGAMVMIMAMQALALMVFLPWWRRLYPGSFIERRVDASFSHASAVSTFAILLLVAVATQFFGGAVLDLAEPLFPGPIADYSEMVERVGALTIASVVSAVVLAPIGEEVLCRGIMLEYALRAVSPGWEPRWRARGLTLSSRAFWVAAVVQALAFGALHMNWIQGSYAFMFGVLEVWVYWRTGRLRYPICLHLAFNCSAFLVEPLAPVIDVLPAPLVLVVAGVLIALGIRMFGHAWPASDALAPAPVVTAAAADASVTTGAGRGPAGDSLF